MNHIINNILLIFYLRLWGIKWAISVKHNLSIFLVKKYHENENDVLKWVFRINTNLSSLTIMVARNEPISILYSNFAGHHLNFFVSPSTAD